MASGRSRIKIPKLNSTFGCWKVYKRIYFLGRNLHTNRSGSQKSVIVTHTGLSPQFLSSTLNLFTTKCYIDHLYHQFSHTAALNLLLSSGFTCLSDTTEISPKPQECVKPEVESMWSALAMAHSCPLAESLGTSSQQTGIFSPPPHPCWPQRSS